MDISIQTIDQLSTHLKALRHACGMSQGELAKRLGLSQSRLARIEGKPESIRVDQLLQLLNAMDVSLVLATKTGTSLPAGLEANAKASAARKTQPAPEW